MKNLKYIIIVIVLLIGAFFYKQQTIPKDKNTAVKNATHQPIEEKPVSVDELMAKQQAESSKKSLTKEQIEAMLDAKFVIVEKQELFELYKRIDQLEGKFKVINAMTEHRIEEWNQRRAFLRDYAQKNTKYLFEELKADVSQLMPKENTGKYEPLRQKLKKQISDLNIGI